MVRQSSAKARTAVRTRSGPLKQFCYYFLLSAYFTFLITRWISEVYLTFECIFNTGHSQDIKDEMPYFWQAILIINQLLTQMSCFIARCCKKIAGVNCKMVPRITLEEAGRIASEKSNISLRGKFYWHYTQRRSCKIFNRDVIITQKLIIWSIHFIPHYWYRRLKKSNTQLLKTE